LYWVDCVTGDKGGSNRSQYKPTDGTRSSGDIVITNLFLEN
jgi:hypothetical protein